MAKRTKKQRALSTKDLAKRGTGVDRRGRPRIDPGSINTIARPGDTTAKSTLADRKKDRLGSSTTVTNRDQLRDLANQGKITPAQLEAGLDRFDRGQAGEGIDPTGFDPDEVRDQVGSVGLSPENIQKRSQRAVPRSVAARQDLAFRASQARGQSTSVDDIINELGGLTSIPRFGLSGGVEDPSISGPIRAHNASLRATAERISRQRKIAQQEEADRRALRSATTAENTVASLVDTGGIAEDARFGSASGAIERSSLSSAIDRAFSGVQGGDLIKSSLMQGLSEFDNAIAQQAEVARMRGESARRADFDTQNFIQQWANREERAKNQLDSVLSSIKEDSEERLESEKDLQDKRLRWEEARRISDIEEERNRSIETANASLALSGGFGSSNGLESVQRMNRQYTEAIEDLRSEVGLRRDELAVSFQSSFSEIQNQYRLNSFNNTRDYQRVINNLAQQGFSSTQARRQAEESALQDFIGNVTNLRLQKAGAIQGVVDEMRSMAAAEREAKRAEEDRLLALRQDDLDFKRKLAFERFKQGLATQADVIAADREMFKTWQDGKDKKSIYLSDQVGKSLSYKAWLTVQPFFQTAKSQRDVFLNDPSTKNAYDFSMVKLFNSMLEPGGRVTDGEFNAAAQGAGWSGTAQQVKDWFSTGGQGIPEDQTKAMETMMGIMTENYKKNFIMENGFAVHQLNEWNDKAPVSAQIDYRTLKGFEFLDIESSKRGDVESDIDDLISDLGLSSNEDFAGVNEDAPDIFGWIDTMSGGRGLSQKFDTPVNYIKGRNFHGGIDIRPSTMGRVGDRIPSFTGGKVIEVSGSVNDKKGFGLSVVVEDENGFKHRYAHLDSTKLKTGQRVSPNQVIGIMGNSGFSTNVHLHYEIKNKKGKLVDPLSFKFNRIS